jgi:hypothetical protein
MYRRYKISDADRITQCGRFVNDLQHRDVASRPTSKLSMQSCQPTMGAVSIVQLAMIFSKLRPSGKNFVNVVGKSPTTPKPGWL